MALRLPAILLVAALCFSQCARTQESAVVTPLPEPAEDPDSCTAAPCPPEPPLTENPPQRYSGSIPLRSFGFVPRVNRAMVAPDQDGALAWLGPSHLLIAFNPHPLVPRHGGSSSGSPVRVIRVVLVDVSTRNVERIVDWRVADRRQFLWVLPGNRALVHVGSEMRIYSAGLRIERRIGLAGPLAFARVSPDGKELALGEVVERHSPEMHARLAAAQDSDPQEDVRVILLNDRFETIASSMSTSESDSPALLNEGQVTIESFAGPQSSSGGRFTLQLRTWGDETRGLGHFRSSCAPELSSVPPDLLFLLTCSSLNFDREVRVLRADGKLVLHRRSVLTEIGQAAGSGGPRNAFAIRVFDSGLPMVPGEPFHPADLAYARLGVYRSQDGKRLFSVRVRDPAASVAGYAVSPYGEVAILTQDGVDLFAMPDRP